MFVCNSFMGDLSEEQEKQLEVFKKYIKDNGVTDHPQYDDYYMLRFLRARKFDMEKTILMFNNFMAWRKDNDVDNILTVRYCPYVVTFKRTSIMKRLRLFRPITPTSITRLISWAAPCTLSAWVS